MRAVDTNVVVRLLAQDDARQLAAARLWVEDGAWVSTLALAEAMWVLAEIYGRSAAEVASSIEILLNHQNLTLQDAEAVAAALRQFRELPSLGFSDCLLLEQARKAGHLPLGTFDRKLGKASGAHRL